MVGKTVLQYQLLEKLGSGGMGEVYKAQDTRLNRFVAIKVLPAKMSADPESRRRFIQEAQAASALNHPNIITIYDVVSEGDTQFMVTEFIAGQTLHDLISPGGLPVALVLQYGTQIADALGAAHAARIIHRDLKPSNIMITPTGLVKILDFGLAKLTDLNPSSSSETAALGPLTQEGAILGTVSYMSPEQAEGKTVDARSDIFSFGSVLYEMISGRRAFDAGSSISTLSSVLRDDVKPLADVAPDTPPLLEAILSRCLAKDPNGRWQSMKEVEKALSSLRRQLDSDIYPPTRNIPTTPAAPQTPDSQTTTQPPPAVPPSVPPPAPHTRVDGIWTSQPAQTGGGAQTPAPPPQAASSPSKSLGLILVLLAVLAVIAAAGGWWWWNNQHKAGSQQAVQTPASQPAAPAQVPAPAPVAENPTPAPAEPAAPVETVLNNASILDLVQANTPAADIVKQIQSSKTNFNVSKQELGRLKQAGVPADVIQAMRRATPAAPKAPPGGPQVAATPPQPSTQPSTQVAPPAIEPPKAPPASRRPASGAATPVSVSDALPFRIALAADVPADAAEGTNLRFTTLDGLTVDNNIVIAKGAVVTGAVMGETGKKKILGIGSGSKLTFRLLAAAAVDGKQVNVRCMSGRRPDGPTVRTFETIKKTKVKGLAAEQGTEYIAYIDGDQTVSVRKQ